MYTVERKSDLDSLVKRYAPLVRRIAFHLSGRLPASVHPADLIQAGMIGLFEAVRNYDVNYGASFVTYAGIRIRGAMLDEVRKSDWAPRSVHRRAREMAQAVAKIESVKCGIARDHEIAETLGITLGEYHDAVQDVRRQRVLNFDDAALDEGAIAEGAFKKDNDPCDALQAYQAQQALAAALAVLPERERLVLTLYYHEELNLREIGAVLTVSESRVCQIHGQALARLKTRLAEERYA